MAIDTTRMSDLVLGKLSPEESLRLLEEIERDPVASEELEARTRLLAQVRSGGEFLFSPVRSTAGRSLRWVRRLWSDGFLSPRLIGAAILVVIALLPLTSALTRGPYVDIARVEAPRYESLLRSVGESDIALAIRLLRTGRSHESLLLLERFCRAYPESDMRQYAHYLAGAVYLVDARRAFLGMFASYDAASVQAGLAHLDEALRLSESPRLVEESHWLRAKALLMLERPDDAIAELRVVCSLEGVRAEDAASLMETVMSRE